MCRTRSSIVLLCVIVSPTHNSCSRTLIRVCFSPQVLIPPKGVKEELRRAAEDPFVPYEKIQHRVQWAQLEKARKKREEDALEKERSMFLVFRWLG